MSLAGILAKIILTPLQPHFDRLETLYKQSAEPINIFALEKNWIGLECVCVCVRLYLTVLVSVSVHIHIAYFANAINFNLFPTS